MTNANTVFDLAADCLCKAHIPAVEGVVLIVTPIAEAHWQEAVGAAVSELEVALAALEDQLPTPEVDALVLQGQDQRRGVLGTLVAAFLLTLRTRVAAPLSPARQAVVRAAARRLAADGGRSLGLTLNSALPEAQTALVAAEGDLLLLMRGRLEGRVKAVEALVTQFLTNRAARTLASAAPSLTLPGATTSLQAWRLQFRELLGLQGAEWLPQVVDVWAYRWFNIGAFITATQGRVGAIIAVNNPPTGPDARTTPFCLWVHGKIISVGRARLQVKRYVDASLQGDLEGVIREWPLLSSSQARTGTAGDFRLRFAKVGLPPYHWRCRTTIRAASTQR